MKKYFCTLELYWNLTPADQISHMQGNTRSYLRKDNSYQELIQMTNNFLKEENYWFLLNMENNQFMS